MEDRKRNGNQEMPRSLNRSMLIGHLGKDAETRHTPNGRAVTNFSIATSYRTKDPRSGEWTDNTDWHDVVLWEAEKVAQYLTKGKRVYVEGPSRTRTWEDKSGKKHYRTEVIADKVSLMLLGGRDGQAGNAAEESQQDPSFDSGGGAGPVADDDISF